MINRARYTAQRGELGKREAVEGRELFLLVDRGWRQVGVDGWVWGEYGKSTPPHHPTPQKKQLERQWKSGNSHRD